MRICFGPDDDPFSALAVLSNEAVAAAKKAMTLVAGDPDLVINSIEASVGDDAGDDAATIVAEVSREGSYNDGSWSKALSIDASELGLPTVRVSSFDGEMRHFSSEIDGVKVRVTLIRRFY